MKKMLRPEAELIPHSKMRPLTRVEYERLAREGFFAREKVELVFGVVVPMSPINPPHATSTAEIHEVILRKIGERARVRCQSSFAASDDSMPEPDIIVIPNDDYWSKLPTRAYLVVEVADSSLRYDRLVKARLYAEVDVDEYWIVDVNAGCVEVYRDRRDDQWCTITTHSRGETIAPLAFPDVVIAVSEIVPPID